MTGVDLTRIDGLNESSVLKILSETGSDISSWPTEKHFCSWLGLSPGNKVTGCKRLSGKTKPSANRAAAAFRLAAFGLLHSKSALGAYCRRQRTRLGAPKAITATAHKLARTFYSMLKNGTEYVDKGQDYYEKQYRDRIVNNLKKRAADMGFDLITKDTVVV
jgi:transposase